MADDVLTLHLNREQQSHLFAHTVTYQFCLALHPATLLEKLSLEIVREVSYRLMQLSLSGSEETLFVLYREEGEVLKEMLLELRPLYEQGAITETYMEALKSLSVCRVLLQEAEQQTSTQTGQ